MDGTRGRGPANRPCHRPLALHQLKADLLDDLLHRHAGQSTPRVLHLLQQQLQLSPVALWEPSPEPFKELF